MNQIDVLIESNASAVRRMDEITPVLSAWFEIELARIHSTLPTSTGGILLGCPVWGDVYVDRMLRYSLPTLGGERNLAALAGKSVIVFYGLRAERGHIFKATRWLRQAGIMTLFRDIPAEAMSILQTKDDKYGLLACIQNLLAHEAGHHAMGLHMYMPDHAYCDGYFERLAKLGGKYPAIVQQSMSVNIDEAKDDFEYWRQKGDLAIAISPQEMGRIILNRMHERSRAHVMNDGGSVPDRMPDSRQIAWIGKNAIHIADPCHLIAWLCPQLCQDAPISFTSTLDMLHPDYIPPGSWFMPGPDDGMVFTELTGSDRIGPPDYVSFDRFLMRAWQQVAFTNDYLEYLAKRCLVPIPEQDDGFLPDDEIERQHGLILDLLKANKTRAMEMYFRSQCPPRWAA